MNQFGRAFAGLSSADKQKRAASVALLLDRLGNSSAEDLEYVLRRLVSGFAGAHGASRLGFSSALSEVFRKVESASIARVLELVDEHLALAVLQGLEYKETALGRVFLYGALVKSGRLAGDAVDERVKISNGLIDLAESRKYLCQVALAVLKEVLVCVDGETRSKLWITTILPRLRKPLDAPSADMMWLALALERDNVVENPGRLLEGAFGATLRAGSLLSIENVAAPHFGTCVRDAAASQENLHPLWSCALDVASAVAEGHAGSAVGIGGLWSAAVGNELLGNEKADFHYFALRLLVLFVSRLSHVSVSHMPGFLSAGLVDYVFKKLANRNDPMRDSVAALVMTLPEAIKKLGSEAASHAALFLANAIVDKDVNFAQVCHSPLLSILTGLMSRDAALSFALRLVKHVFIEPSGRVHSEEKARSHGAAIDLLGGIAGKSMDNADVVSLVAVTLLLAACLKLPPTLRIEKLAASAKRAGAGAAAKALGSISSEMKDHKFAELGAPAQAAARNRLVSMLASRGSTSIARECVEVLEICKKMNVALTRDYGDRGLAARSATLAAVDVNADAEGSGMAIACLALLLLILQACEDDVDDMLIVCEALLRAHPSATAASSGSEDEDREGVDDKWHQPLIDLLVLSLNRTSSSLRDPAGQLVSAVAGDLNYVSVASLVELLRGDETELTEDDDEGDEDGDADNVANGSDTESEVGGSGDDSGDDVASDLVRADEMQLEAPGAPVARPAGSGDGAGSDSDGGSDGSSDGGSDGGSDGDSEPEPTAEEAAKYDEYLGAMFRQRRDALRGAKEAVLRLRSFKMRVVDILEVIAVRQPQVAEISIPLILDLADLAVEIDRTNYKDKASRTYHKQTLLQRLAHVIERAAHVKVLAVLRDAQTLEAPELWNLRLESGVDEPDDEASVNVDSSVFAPYGMKLVARLLPEKHEPAAARALWAATCFFLRLLGGTDGADACTEVIESLCGEVLSRRNPRIQVNHLLKTLESVRVASVAALPRVLVKVGSARLEVQVLRLWPAIRLSMLRSKDAVVAQQFFSVLGRLLDRLTTEGKPKRGLQFVQGSHRIVRHLCDELGSDTVTKAASDSGLRKAAEQLQLRVLAELPVSKRVIPDLLLAHIVANPDAKGAATPVEAPGAAPAEEGPAVALPGQAKVHRKRPKPEAASTADDAPARPRAKKRRMKRGAGAAGNNAPRAATGKKTKKFKRPKAQSKS